MFANTFTCRSIAFAAVCAGCAAVCGKAAAASTDNCDLLLAEAPVTFEAIAELRGRERASWEVRLPAQATVTASVGEDGLDLILDVVDASGRIVGRAESPVQRHGTQRVAFVTKEAAGYVIGVAGKEHPDAKGRASLRVLSMPAKVSFAPCLAIQRALAAGDTAFAAAQAATGRDAGKDATDASATYKVAVAEYRKAAKLLSGSKPSHLRAQAQHAEAAVFNQSLQDWGAARTAAHAATLSYESAADAFGKAQAQVIEAEARMELAALPRPGVDNSRSASEELMQVRELLNGIAQFHSGRGETFEEAVALNDVGISFHLEGRFDDAIREFRRAVPLYEQLQEKPRAAQALQNIAVVEYELGRLSQAIPHYRKVLTLIRQDDDPVLFASILNNSGLASWASGDHDSALRQLGEALSIVRTAQDAYWQAVVLHNMGCVYDALGDQGRALEFYQRALKLRTTELDPRGQAASLRTIGNILRERGRKDEALKMHRDALALASTPSARGRVLVQIARDLGALGRTSEALQELEPVIARSGRGDEVVRARALAVRGQYTGSGEKDAARAEQDLRDAIETFRRYELPVDEFEAWVALARSMRQRGALDKALDSVERALALAEEVRLQSANPELRATLLQPLRPAFDLKISMLAERYFAMPVGAGGRESIARLALSTAERARARALADFQSLDISAPGVPADLARQRQAIYRELAARRFRIATSIDRAGTQDARVRTIGSDIASLRRQLDEIDARIGAASNKAADASIGSGAASPLQVRQLPADTGLVEYWLGGEEGFAWGITSDAVVMVRLGASDAITETARSFYTALRGFGSVPEERRLSLGAQFYDMAVKPLGPQVLERRRLVFIPDGALHYIPFAAVRSTDVKRARFLIETHDVAVTPSVDIFLNRRASQPRETPTRQMLLVSDPVYGLDDLRLATRAARNQEKRDMPWPLSLLRGADQDSHLARLPGSAKEAATIAALLPKDGVDRLEGFTATRERFLNARLSQYRFIHVASHAIADTEVPQASALIFSRFDSRSQEMDGRVLAADFINVQLNAQAVVLSACDTALGKNISGEGLVGLRYVVLARGARAVISSLWPVADQVSAELMPRFYTALLHEQSRVSPALSEAMRAAIAGRFKDPGLWAAYALTVAGVEGA